MKDKDTYEGQKINRKTDSQIIAEIEKRKKLQIKNWGDMRRNTTVINTLKWVLGLNSKINGWGKNVTK